MSWSNRWEYIAATTLTGTAASVSFNPVPTDFRKFFIVGFVVNDANAKTVTIRFNNDSGANYAQVFLNASGAGFSGSLLTAQTSILLLSASLAVSDIGLFCYEVSKPSTAEVARTVGGAGYNTTIVLDEVGGEWTNTAALISRIDVLASANNFAAGTKILLYGSRD